MSSACTDLSCPVYLPFTTAAAETEAEKKAREDAEKAAYDASPEGMAMKAIESIKVVGATKSVVEKCKAYCKEIEKAEAEKCRILREKVKIALKAAGCPSNVTPSGGKSRSSYSSSSKATTATTSRSGTRGGCASGKCGR